METLSVRNIDLTLRDAGVCNAELNILHHQLEKLENNGYQQRRIEVRMATLFKEMMSALYTVLDQCYYYLYCHFQNKGKPSFHNAALTIKTPVKQKLKHSEDETRDSQQECRGNRRKFVNEQCSGIFGDRFKNGEEIPNLRWFQDNLLTLQVITEVDEAGAVLQCPDGTPKCVRVKKITYAKEITHAFGPEPNPNWFNPTGVTFEKLESVQDLDGWSDTTIFNLLHFFRNFTTHRALITCPAKNGYLNLETREFKAEGEEGAGDARPWIKVAKGAWILVPEISHLKDQNRQDPPRFHEHRLLIVCSQILGFVKQQRSLLLKMADYDESPITVLWYLSGELKFKRGSQEIGVCSWKDSYGCFRLWPVED